MAKVIWGKRALRELEEIDSYIAMQSEMNAAIVGDRILRAVSILAEHPEIGRTGRLPGSREFAIPSTPFVLAYRIRKADVWILGIQRGAKSWPTRL